MNIAIIGSGYVGLVTGPCLASFGHKVVCADVDEKKIALLQDIGQAGSEGKLPIYEPRLGFTIRTEVGNGRLFFTTDVERACRGADVIFCCVGTPTVEGGADLSYVFGAAKMAAKVSTDGMNRVFVLKSTVPVGTNAAVAKLVPANLHVANNPEFLAEGNAVDDFLHPDRIVIGARSTFAFSRLREVYRPFFYRDRPPEWLEMSPESAELTKYAANAMLATRISFSNELATLCERVGADYKDVQHGYGTDKRIGEAFLRAGVGFGGSCFPKDVKALLHTAGEHSTMLGVVHAAMVANERAHRNMVERIVKTVGEGGSLHGKKVALWGVAFKPETDDTRESPAVAIGHLLREYGAEVVAYDPIVKDSALPLAPNALEAAKGADALCVVTDWGEFKAMGNPEWQGVSCAMRGVHVFDGRNCLAESAVIESGLLYHGVGRAV